MNLSRLGTLGIAAAVLLFASVGGVRAVEAQTAQTAPLPQPGFSSVPTYGSLGLALVVFTGGTVDQLATAAAGAGASGVWVQDSTGRYQLLPVGAPAFITSSFAGAFAPAAPGAANFTGLTAVTLVAPSTTSPSIVTLANDGQTITMRVGETFSLQLGETYSWSASVVDQSILSRVVNVTVVRGSQGIFAAKAPGQTTLNASGGLVCAANQPCPALARVFRVQVVVLP